MKKKEIKIDKRFKKKILKLNAEYTKYLSEINMIDGQEKSFFEWLIFNK